jgi:hypothetical protein
MSSEESDGEIGTAQRIFHVKALPWRHPNLTKWLHSLDAFPRNPSGIIGMRSYSKRTRQRTADQKLLSSVRQPPRGLAQALFDPSWLASRSTSARRQLEITCSSSKVLWGNDY